MTKPTTTTELLELATEALAARDRGALLELIKGIDPLVHHRRRREKFWAKAAFKSLLRTMADAASVLERLERRENERLEAAGLEHHRSTI